MQKGNICKCWSLFNIDGVWGCDKHAIL